LSSLKLGASDHDRSPQLMKLLDENLQWNDSALEVRNSINLAKNSEYCVFHHYPVKLKP